MSQAIDIVIPVHNEGASIAQTLSEFHEVCQGTDHPVRFIACEDGSVDDTVEVLKRVAQTLPLVLISEKSRKGYARAVIDGFAASQSDPVGFIDSDGQCDPKDFRRLYEQMAVSGVDLIVGYRNPRQDHWMRRLMSSAFGVVYRFYFHVPLKDPSCPYLIIRAKALKRILQGNAGILKQGFWWEFYARAFAVGLKIEEIPVGHRHRLAGETQVYKLKAIPGIAWSHLRGLAQLHAELNKASSAARPGAS